MGPARPPEQGVRGAQPPGKRKKGWENSTLCQQNLTVGHYFLGRIGLQDTDNVHPRPCSSIHVHPAMFIQDHVHP